VSLKHVGIIGGGWAGLSAATHLVDAGIEVSLFERSRILGGRSTSFWDKNFGEWLDHGQHIMIGAYREAFGLLKKWGSFSGIRFLPDGKIPWIMEDGKVHQLDFSGSTFRTLYSILNFDFLNLSEKANLTAGLGKLKSYESKSHSIDLTVAEVLGSTMTQSEKLRYLFQALSLAVMNAPLEVAAAAPLAMAIREGLLSSDHDGNIGYAYQPLKVIVNDAFLQWSKNRKLNVYPGSYVTDIGREAGFWKIEIKGNYSYFDAVIITGSPVELPRLLPSTNFGNIFSFVPSKFDYSPIAGIHCTFDREILDVPFAHLYNSKFQWIFGRGLKGSSGWNKVSFVVSDADESFKSSAGDVKEELLADLHRRFPRSRNANLTHFRLINTRRATVVLTPSNLVDRPTDSRLFPNLHIAGDWLDTGLPATIESAARSGRLTAENLISELKNYDR